MKAVSNAAANMPLTELDGVLLQFKIPSLDKVPNYQALYQVANCLGLHRDTMKAA
jgi:hypothetical protein